VSQPTSGQGWIELLRALPACILTDANIDEHDEHDELVAVPTALLFGPARRRPR